MINLLNDKFCRRFLILLILAISKFVNAGTADHKFYHIGLEKGLSQVSAISLFQDSTERIWIGTREGLNCYDGTSIISFYPDNSDASALVGHEVYKIMQNGDNLWLLTNIGLSALNLHNLQFQHYSTGRANDMIFVDGNLIIAKQSGIYLLNQKEKILESVNWNIPQNIDTKTLFKDKRGRIWIGSTKNGIFLYDSKAQKYRKICSVTANDFFEDSRYNYWIATEHDGVILLDSCLNETAHFKQQKKELVHNNIRQIVEDHEGNIWIGTFLGLTIFNPVTEKFSLITHNPDDPMSLSHNSIFAIIKGTQKTMWVGTYFGGVSYYSMNEEVYKHYYNYPGSRKDQISFPVVRKIKEDGKGNIWIGTEGGGLNVYNRKDEEFYYYSNLTEEIKLSGNNVIDFCFEDKDIIYATVHLGGLNKIDLKSKTVKYFQHDENDSSSIHTDRVTDIIHFGENFLIGGFGGVSLFNPDTEKFSPFRIGYSGIVNCIFEDSSQNLWFGTENNGVYKYNTEEKEGQWYLHHKNDSNSISSNNICQVFEDIDGNLWLATLGGGLCRYNRDEESFTTYSKAQNRLLSNFVFGIEQSKHGHLWISTRKGLTMFDHVNNHFYHYDYSGGFPLKELNMTSLLLTEEGELFVGGIDGLISLKEDIVLNKHDNVNLFLTKLIVNNKEVRPLDHTKILNEIVDNSKVITLKPDHVTFSLFYSAPIYNPSDNIIYQHKLVGYDKEWIDPLQNAGSYANVNPGSYIFNVRCLNAFNRMVVAEKSIKIVVKPPFYKAWYAYFIYLITALFLILWLHHNYKSKLKLDQQLALEHKEKENIQLLNQAKLRFFTNVSHEFKTPLTLIMGSLEMIMEEQKIEPDYYNQLRVAYSNAFNLKSLVDELIDFRKLEQGYLTIKVREHIFSDFLREIYYVFIEYANYRQIDYTLKMTDYPVNLWIDPKQIQKVFFNLITNAFKYVKPKEGVISVELVDDDEYAEVRVVDNGIGIPEEKNDLIFERFYQIENNLSDADTEGSGIGLALSKGIVDLHKGEIYFISKENIGTTFFVRLKKGRDHYAADQFDNNEKEVKTDISPKIIHVSESSDTLPERVEDSAPLLLIAEDNSDMRELLVNLFSKTCRIIVAENGESALVKAVEMQPDLIISDVMMPKMSGTELCVKIKRNIQTCHIPVILLTARTALSYKLEGIETGADDYVEKPFNIKLLKAKVRNLLQNRKILQNKFSSEPSFEVRTLAGNQIDKDLLEKALRIVNDNLADPQFNIDDFAGAMGLGRTRLFEKIKGLTGQTPNEFIQTIRMNRAAEMLMHDPGLNISEIAYSVGFNSPKYFSSYFRRHFGISPSQYLGKSE